MGKKSKHAAGLAKAASRKLDKSILPAPPPPPEEEVSEWMNEQGAFSRYCASNR